MAKTQNLILSSLLVSIFSSPHPQYYSLTPLSPNLLSLKPSVNSHFFGLKTQNPPLGILTRQSVVPAVSGLWDAITGSGGNSAREALIAVRRGMELFRQGDVSGSVAEFDKAIKLDPRQKAYLWQRGLSLYYLDRFEEGAQQFRIDVAQNPNDTEESIWCFLCEAQLYGVDEARKLFLEVGRDPRPVMREAYNMFKDGGDPEKLVATFSSGRENEYFYASLYAGLYYECQSKPDGAKRHILNACQSPYGLRSDDYMVCLSGPMIIWLLLQKFTLNVETGALARVLGSVQA